MQPLLGKKIILGITGSIAAYKSVALVRLFIKAGASVQVLMTDAAKDFVGSVTLATLSKRPVLSDVHSGEAWNNHVELGLWADVMVIAPATANTLAKLANGICDNVLTAVYLSARCPVFIAPAMDVDMWHHPSTRKNIERLEDFGNRLIPVEHGELASGLIGEGRMAEPESIFNFLLKNHFNPQNALEGLSVLVTAGPTYEPIDPVRFIGNHSSGKMGAAIVDVLLAQGANVSLVLGPSKLSFPKHPRLAVVRVRTAQEMYEAAMSFFETSDVAILSAAVADYRPKVVATQKIKKKENELTLELEKTPDIAAALGKMKKHNQMLVGFALETENELENAKAKLVKKNLDFIVLNSLNDQGAGFNHETNRITIVRATGETYTYPLKTKSEVAADIVAVIRENR